MSSGDLLEIPEGASLSKYVENLWGRRTRLVPQVTVAVLTTSTRVVKGNPRRMLLMIVNQGVGQVTVDWTASIVAGVGVPLAPQGGTLILTAFEDGELVGYEMTAIAGAVGNNLSVWEVEAL